MADPSSTRLVAIAVLDGVVAGDLSAACEFFGRVTQATRGTAAYDVRVCAEDALIDAGWFQLAAPHRYDVIAEAHTVVLPGIHDIRRPIPESLCAAVREAHRRGARITSICTGAFVLAATGLLSGRRATTHWAAADELARRYPDVEVDASVLYVDDGDVLTSAGAVAGNDLCLHLIRCDLGADIAARVARFAVVPLEREGGQAQFIEHPLPEADADLGPLLEWIQGNLRQDLTVPDLARRVAMSPRNFSRRFVEQTGTTPARWVQTARIRRAQRLLEVTTLTVERIAEEVGYGSASTLREGFRRVVGTAPFHYRRNFGRPA